MPTVIGLVTVKFCTDAHGLEMMGAADLDDPYFIKNPIKYLNTYKMEWLTFVADIPGSLRHVPKDVFNEAQ